MGVPGLRTPWASIAKIAVGGEHKGTGFLIAPKLLVTAFHVVEGADGQAVQVIGLNFNPNAEHEDGRPAIETEATLLPAQWSREHDFAIFECAKSPNAKPLVLTERCRRMRDFLSPGFGGQDPGGFSVTGSIASLNEPEETGGPVFGLQLDSGSGVLVEGHSGAPVIVDGRVVALLRTAYLDEYGGTKGGLIRATPIRHVVESCNNQNPGILRYNANIVWPQPNLAIAPIVADRKNEFHEFERMITGQSQKRVLLVEGGSGHGKSVLVEEFKKYAQRLGVTIAIANLKSERSIDTVFRSFQFSAGEDAIPQPEDGEKDSYYTRVIDHLSSFRSPFLLIIDTWEAAPDDLAKWVEYQLFPQLDRMPHLTVMIAGQKVPAPDHLDAETVVEHSRLGLIPVVDDWLDFCARRWPSVPIVRQHVEGILFASNLQLTPSQMYSNLDTVQRILTGNAASGAAR